VCLWLLAIPVARAQSAEQATASCTFEDGKQISVRYHAVGSEHKLATGRVWPPVGSPLILFSEGNLLLGGAQIPVGAYSMYVIPREKVWTLVVNRDVTPGGKYDEQQDIVRVPMQIADAIQSVDRLQVVFVRAAAKQCNLRFYYGKIGVYGAELKEQ